MTLHLFISGRVTNVGFRFWAKQTADNLGLTGWVRNVDSGVVEIMASGDKEKLEIFLEKCRRGPMFTRVDNIQAEWKKDDLEKDDFDVVA